PALKGKNPTYQKEIDQFLIKLDGTENKSKLGVNAILPVSIAVCKSGAFFKKLPPYLYIQKLIEVKPQSVRLPRMCFNIINGGAHAGNDLDFQEFMICPKTKSVAKSVQIATEIYQTLKEEIKKRYGKLATNVGDEGGFAPQIKNPKEAIELILFSAKKLNLKEKIDLILDVAASQFFDGKKYKTNFGEFSGRALFEYYKGLILNYKILGLEDPFAEDDFESWQFLNLHFKALKFKILIIGDDLLATNPKRIKIAKEKNLCNSAIIKLNQIGTVSEAIEAVKLAKSFGFKIIVSHRSGETNDDFVADFAVGVLADFVKFGAPVRGERVAKYNRLLKIEQQLCV
ncbi:phosphopyruvate hydratase, partial [Candidatus Parcubacteria bacterium]|nr:phosphopyruvate hydratase [Candidatus Parcubacteria bacterium]